MITNNNKWNQTAEYLLKIKQAIKYYQEMERVYLNDLKDLSGGLSASNDNYEFELVVKQGPIDYTKIPQLTGISLEPYRKESVETWILKVKPKLPEGMEVLENK